MAILYLTEYCGPTHMMMGITYHYVTKHIERVDGKVIKRTFEYSTDQVVPLPKNTEEIEYD